MKFEDWFTDIYTKHLRERKIEDKLQLAFNEGVIEGAKLFGKTQTDEIGQVDAEVIEDLINKHLPETFFAGLNSEERLKRLVEHWQRAIEVNQELQVQEKEGVNNVAELRNLLSPLFNYFVIADASITKFEQGYFMGKEFENVKTNLERIKELLNELG